MCDMKWRPIDTAPRDGSRILLAAIGNSDRYEAGAVVADPTPRVWWACVGEWSAKYRRFWDRIEPSGFAHLSHWMPLPQPKEINMTDRIDSTSDDRTVNNVMRHEYRVLSETEKAEMKELKDIGITFYEACDRIGSSREMSLAKTKIEEAVVWAVKHITR